MSSLFLFVWVVRVVVVGPFPFLNSYLESRCYSITHVYIHTHTHMRPTTSVSFSFFLFLFVVFLSFVYRRLLFLNNVYDMTLYPYDSVRNRF
jgi:hypothetical protein